MPTQPSPDSAPALPVGIPIWMSAALAALVAYMVVMYGVVMRLTVGISVVLMPWLLRQEGYRLYENVYLPYMPGYAWLVQALALFPDPLIGARSAMIVTMLASLALVFGLGHRWWGPVAGLAAAVLYAGWGPTLMDRPFYLEVPMGVCAVLALAVWHQASSGAVWWRPLLAGIFCGAAILIKQQGVAVAAVFVIWRGLAALAARDTRRLPADLGLFALGLAVPLGLTGLVLSLQGRLDAMLYWTWAYNLDNPFETRTLLDIGLRENLFLLGWLALVPLYALFVIPQRASWQSQGILMLGLLVALLTPIYPRYNRFHLSAAVPVVALIGAGALWHALAFLGQPPTEGDAGSRALRPVLQTYLAAAIGLLALAFALPTYYRVRLGPEIGEYEPLLPVVAAMQNVYDIGPGSRVWLATSLDPTDNLIALGRYYPAPIWVQTYPWFQDVPGMPERVVATLDAQTAPYAVVMERWREMMPPEYERALEQDYEPIGEAQATHGYGAATIYRRRE